MKLVLMCITSVFLQLLTTVQAAEVKLEFSNGWVVMFEDSKFGDYDYKGPEEKKWVHKIYQLTAFTGTDRMLNNDAVIYRSGVFQHTLRNYRFPENRSLIEFTQSIREDFVDNKAQLFQQDQILFKTLKREFTGMTNISEALQSSIGQKGFYSAIHLVKDHRDSTNNKKTESRITLVAMTINGVQQEKNH
ncbi:hypothetical protein [Marinicella meishanensis]|uniref:hypothetical protein n=1 Tax=Marinicella meishanensis TaxID=2873263 RepID=UPI001CBD67BC|nr:hypothetical protein [Marinicella sp. NBU2979]